MPSLRHLTWLACGLALAQTGQSAFEPANFNVSAALEEHGIDVSSIPTEGLQKRSREASCRFAVGGYPDAAPMEY